RRTGARRPPDPGRPAAALAPNRLAATRVFPPEPEKGEPMSTRITAGTVLLAAALLVGAASAASPLMLGPSTHKQLALYQGYYDGHKDGYVITDVSNKAQAIAWHVNFAPILKGTKG